MTITRTSRLTIPDPRPAVPILPTAAKDCGACNGQGGSWVTNDGRTPGKNIREWVPCGPCNGRGKQ